MIIYEEPIFWKKRAPAIKNTSHSLVLHLQG